MALVLNARKLLYDGGILESQFLPSRQLQELYQNLLLKMNETAYEAAAAWVELERFKSLNSLIDLRLGVLDPLITQLEKVAEAVDKLCSRSTKNSYNDHVAQRSHGEIRACVDLKTYLALYLMEFLLIHL